MVSYIDESTQCSKSKTCWSKSRLSKWVVCKLPHHQWNNFQLQAVRDLHNESKRINGCILDACAPPLDANAKYLRYPSVTCYLFTNFKNMGVNFWSRLPGRFKMISFWQHASDPRRNQGAWPMSTPVYPKVWSYWNAYPPQMWICVLSFYMLLPRRVLILRIIYQSDISRYIKKSNFHSALRKSDHCLTTWF